MLDDQHADPVRPPNPSPTQSLDMADSIDAFCEAFPYMWASTRDKLKGAAGSLRWQVRFDQNRKRQFDGSMSQDPVTFDVAHSDGA